MVKKILKLKLSDIRQEIKKKKSFYEPRIWEFGLFSPKKKKKKKWNALEHFFKSLEIIWLLLIYISVV